MIREQCSIIILAYKLILHDRRVYFQADTFGVSKVQHFRNAACASGVLFVLNSHQNGEMSSGNIRTEGSVPYEFVHLQIFRTSKSCRLASSVGVDFHFIHKFF